MVAVRAKARKGNAAALALMSVLALGLPICQGQAPRPTYEKLALPGGRPFPASQASLLCMRDKADKRAVEKMRAHAWDLFAGLTRGKTPIWNTWYTKCDLGLVDCGADPPGDKDSPNRLLGSFEVPVQFLEQLSERALVLKNNSSVESHGSELIQVLKQFLIDQIEHPQFASVLFDEEAKSHIISDCLHPLKLRTGGSSAAGCSPNLDTPRKIRDFDPGSVVLKTTWALVPKEGGLISTYDPCVWNKIRDLHCAETPNPSINVATSHGDIACKQGDDGMPLSCFYYIQLTKKDADWANEHQSDLLLPIGSFFPVNCGDYLVLMGIHVTTKETPDWVWATFWWDIHAAKDPKAAGRPASIRGKWRHFLMDTTLSATTPAEKEDQGPKICFNPYLELKFVRNGKTIGKISNCLQCHSKAAYALGNADAASGYDEGVLARDGKTLAIGDMASPVYPDACYFDNRVATDFLWSIAFVLDPKSLELKRELKIAIASLLEDQRLKQLGNPPTEPKH